MVVIVVVVAVLVVVVLRVVTALIVVLRVVTALVVGRTASRSGTHAPDKHVPRAPCFTQNAPSARLSTPPQVEMGSKQSVEDDALHIAEHVFTFDTPQNVSSVTTALLESVMSTLQFV